MTPDAQHMLAAIRADVADGRVPPTVASFSALHDHVDANEYILAAPNFAAIYRDATSADDWLPLGNRLADEVDAAIRTGALR